MAGKQYLNAFINNSATIRETVAADIENAAHKAVVYDGDGNLILPAADGDPAVGVILSDAAAFDNGASFITSRGSGQERRFPDSQYQRAGEKGCSRKFHSRHCHDRSGCRW